MSALDIVAGALAAFAGWVGFRQGLSVILLRCCVVAAGLSTLRLTQPYAASWIQGWTKDWTPFASVALVFLGVLLVQEVLALVWRKTRDALLLGIPDRLMGLAAGLILGASLTAVGGTILKGAHPTLEKAWQQSHMHPVMEKAAPWIREHVTPETLTRGKERLKSLVDPPAKP